MGWVPPSENQSKPKPSITASAAKPAKSSVVSGSGLGKNGQGDVNPLSVEFRSTNDKIGLGAKKRRVDVGFDIAKNGNKVKAKSSSNLKKGKRREEIVTNEYISKEIEKQKKEKMETIRIRNLLRTDVSDEQERLLEMHY